MNFKRFTLILIILMAVSITAVSAADNLTDEVAIDDVNNDAQGDEVLSVDVTGNTITDIQNAINNANEGDTVNLGTNKAYDVGSNQITIGKKITLTGNNVNITGSSADGVISIRSASDISIIGLTFINPVDLPDYGDRTFSGKAIYTNGATNILIDNCKFINYAYGIEMYTSQYSTIKNSWFNGETTSVSGMAGTGTKAIQLMGSKDINVLNNTFYGQIYDSLSIASSSSNVLIENNEFINNTFAIFYGGASTEGNKIKNNKFITCGMINKTYYISSLKMNSTDAFFNLPYIGMQKASSDIEISGNEFIVKDNNRIIYSEAENTAHGFPSVIGGINITNNIVKKADASVNDESLTFYQLIIVTSLSIDPTDDIILKDNNFSDTPNINKFDLQFNALQYNETSGDVVIPKAKLSTYLSIVYVNNGRVVVQLSDISGKAIVDEKINYKINSGSRLSSNTDEYGHIYIEDLTDLVKLSLEYYGSVSYDRCTLDTEIQANPSQTGSQITASALSVNTASATSTYYSITLKDTNGNNLANKQVSFTINGNIYTANTGNNGVASLKIPINTAGNYPVTIAFNGDSNYKGSVAVSTINIVKQATKLTVAKKTFKKSATKKVTATLKAGSKAISGKKLTLKVNGKSYTAKTNSKGVATFKVKLTKKGTFKATTKFAGDSVYSAKSTTSKIIIK